MDGDDSSEDLQLVVKPYQRVLIEDPAIGEPDVRLWRSVVMQAISDCIDPEQRQEIIAWIPTQDFADVCWMAGLEPSKLAPIMAKVVLGKKPHNIVLANRLKMLVYYATTEVA